MSKTSFTRNRHYDRLTPLARSIMDRAEKDGSITAREACLYLDVDQGSFTKRITDISRAGFTVVREKKLNPHTGKLYTRYTFFDSIRQTQAA